MTDWTPEKIAEHRFLWEMVKPWPVSKTVFESARLKYADYFALACNNYPSALDAIETAMQSDAQLRDALKVATLRMESAEDYARDYVCVMDDLNLQIERLQAENAQLHATIETMQMIAGEPAPTVQGGTTTKEPPGWQCPLADRCPQLISCPDCSFGGVSRAKREVHNEHLDTTTAPTTGTVTGQCPLGGFGR